MIQLLLGFLFGLLIAAFALGIIIWRAGKVMIVYKDNVKIFNVDRWEKVI